MKIRIVMLVCMLYYSCIFTMQQGGPSAGVPASIFIFRPVLIYPITLVQWLNPPVAQAAPVQSSHSQTMGLSLPSEHKEGKSVAPQPHVTETRVNGYREFCCSECSETFSTKFSAQRHLKKHTGDTPFHCQVAGCDRRFAEKTTLERHMVAHNKEKPFGCVCDKWYADRQNAIKHIALCSIAGEAGVSMPLVNKVKEKS